MVAGHPGRRGARIDRDLVRFAEELSVERGLAVMQLGLLLPRGRTHPITVSLDDWYTRIGYRPVRTGTLEDRHPQLAPLLATSCDFVVYHKPLAVLRSTLRGTST